MSDLATRFRRMPSDPISVRPTKRCIGDLELELDLPDLGTPLDEIDDPVVVNAQAVPEQRDAGGVERVASARPARPSPPTICCRSNGTGGG